MEANTEKANGIIMLRCQTVKCLVLKVWQSNIILKVKPEDVLLKKLDLWGKNILLRRPHVGWQNYHEALPNPYIATALQPKWEQLRSSPCLTLVILSGIDEGIFLTPAWNLPPQEPIGPEKC